MNNTHMSYVHVHGMGIPNVSCVYKELLRQALAQVMVQDLLLNVALDVRHFRHDKDGLIVLNFFLKRFRSFYLHRRSTESIHPM